MELRPIRSLHPALPGLCDAMLGGAQVPGASITIVADDWAYHLGWGVKSLASGEPVTARTGFDIASCSKAFVSATLASLVADGLVGWDDPISRYVPEFKLYDCAVTQHATLRDLSANRLGLPRGGLMEFGLHPRLAPEHIFPRLRHTAPVHHLRERFGYFNAGHVANAVAIGRITGKGFLATLRERILEPLGMTSTSGGKAARDALGDQAAWHGRADGEMVGYDTLYNDATLGASGMVVSGQDAAAWLRLHLNAGRVDGRQVIAAATLRETHTPQIVARPGQDIACLFFPGAAMAAYALGWAVSDLDGQPLVCHSGSSLGVSAMTVLLPRAGIGIAVYANATGPHAPPLALGLAGQLLGLAARDWQAALTVPAPPRVQPPLTPMLSLLRDCAGDYAHPADGALHIEVSSDGARLQAQVPDGYRLDFCATPLTDHHFAVRFCHPEWRALLGQDSPELVFSVVNGRSIGTQMLAGPLSRTFSRRFDRV